MFSYIEEGIKCTIPVRQITLPQLVKIIRNNPKKTFIESIIELKRKGDLNFRILKKKLPNITPNCIVKKRSLDGDEFGLNFTCSSGYMYIDIDYKGDNILEYKKYFIEKYGHLVSLVSLSSTHGGLSVLISITNPIKSHDDFFQVWNNLKDTILKDEVIDKECKDIGRAMFIPFDTDVYVNYENEITVEIKKKYTKDCIEKSRTQPISVEGVKHILNHTFYKIYGIEILLKVLYLKTKVDCNNPILDLKAVDYTEVTFHKNIKDGNKRKMYNSMIHGLVFLNPNIEPDYIFSYIHFINSHYATPSMEFGDLVYLFNSVYNSIKNNSKYVFKNKRIKWVHYNPSSGLKPSEKRTLSNKINGKRRGSDSINKILEAKEYLRSNGIKITQVKIMELTSLSISTVKAHYRKENVFDLDQYLNEINNGEVSQLPNRNTFEVGNFKNEQHTQMKDYIHPDCPNMSYKVKIR